ncbi:glycoside hydrolase family 25 protein, partial [Oharaeibacter diazotrophicus]|uniref:glycoside hydrolase family 25 protein n=1 Tax=Oharaeibacter diazotrophicus TaxID=1920512 RepID=UPI001FEE1E02
MASRRSSHLVTGLRTMLALVALLALGGCGFFGEPDAPAVVTTHNRYPTKGDDKPHPGVARAHRHPVHGIDVSRYQGRIDWNQVAGAGTKFAFIKATEGGDHLDPRFMINWTEAKASGVPRAAYHFVWWCRPAREQASWFIQNVPVDPDALPPVIDVEWQNGANCTRRVSREDAIAKIRIISAMMTARYGKTPIIYTDINFHRDVLEGVGLANPFWLRSTAAEPQVRYRNRRWTMWQWTQTGRVPGIRGHVDRNVFYGSDREWATFVASACDPRDHGRLPGCGDGRRPRTEALTAEAPPPAAV